MRNPGPTPATTTTAADGSFALSCANAPEQVVLYVVARAPENVAMLSVLGTKPPASIGVVKNIGGGTGRCAPQIDERARRRRSSYGGGASGGAINPSSIAS